MDVNLHEYTCADLEVNTDPIMPLPKKAGQLDRPRD